MSSTDLENRFMEFRLGEQLFAIPLLNVKEVIQLPEVTSVPNMPAHFEGMMNLRGQIIGVFSVRKKLSSKPTNTPAESSQVVIVIEESQINVGIIVDEVTRVLHASPESLKPAPLKSDDPANKYVSGVIQSNNDLVLNLNVSQLLELNKYNQEGKAA